MSLTDEKYQELIKKYYMEIEWITDDVVVHSAMETKIPGLNQYFGSELRFNLLREDIVEADPYFHLGASIDVSESLVDKLNKSLESNLWVVSDDSFLKDKTVMLCGKDNHDCSKWLEISSEPFILENNLELFKDELLKFITGLLDFLYRNNAIKKVPSITELDEFCEMFIRKLIELEEHNIKVNNHTYISKLI